MRILPARARKGRDGHRVRPAAVFLGYSPHKLTGDFSMRLTAALLLVSVVLCPLLAATEYDDCDAGFIAAIGSSAYQFSPSHDGELGTVRLFSVLSYQRAAHEQRFGSALWQLRIDRVADGTRVLTLDGRSFIGSEGAALAELHWDGRDDLG